MKLRFCIALLVAKCTYLGMRLLHRSATYLPGYFAVKICPDYLKYIAKANRVICVSGTDGKTTTANLISDLLTKCGYRVEGNRIGSNTQFGIAAAMTNSVTLFNRCRVDAVVLEVDEHYTRVVCPKVHADYLLVTNLLRDSLQRNAHTEYVFGKINLTQVPDMKVILNADEMCSAGLLPDNQRLYFGIDRLPNDLQVSENLVNDYQLCPKCGHRLTVDYVRYAHIGHAHCDSCGFASKEADCHVTGIDYENAMIHVANGQQNCDYPLTNPTIYNIYNEIAAITLLTDESFTDVHSYPDKFPQFNTARESKGLRNTLKWAKEIDLSELSEANADELTAAIRCVHSGKQYLSPIVKGQLKTDPPAPQLTDKQLAILISVTRGLSNDEIARQFGITRITVKGHLKVIFQKLGVANRTEAVAIALRKHLLKT